MRALMERSIIAQKLGILGILQNWEVYRAEHMHEITKFWTNIEYEEDLRQRRLWSGGRLWSGAPTGPRVFG